MVSSQSFGKYQAIRLLKGSKEGQSLVVRHESRDDEHFVLRTLRIDPEKSTTSLNPWHFHIKHPNFAEILEIGIKNRRQIFFTRNFYKSRLRLSPDSDVLAMLVGITRYLEINSLWHGGLKPNNLYFESGHVVVADRP